MVGEPNKPKSSASTMESHPDYVQAIGMITIELANLEIDLADLFGALLDKNTVVAHAIYFTPRATIARVAAIDNLASTILPRDDRILKRIKALTKRARASMEKRHNLIHAAWGIDPDSDNGVVYSPLPLKMDATCRVKLEDLRSLAREMRVLTDEIAELAREIRPLVSASQEKDHE